MSETLQVSVFLDESRLPKRTLILDHKFNRFLNVRVSTAKEIYDRSIDRNYKDILNPYMVFNIDFCNEFNIAKSNKNFLKQFSYSSKDVPYLWDNSPKEVKGEYEKVFAGFKNLKPKVKKFVLYNPRLNENFNEPEICENFKEPEINEPKINEDFNGSEINENFNGPEINLDFNGPEINENVGTDQLPILQSDFPSNLITSEHFPSDVNAFLNYVEENRIIPNLGM
jgi:hypothetical protein